MKRKFAVSILAQVFAILAVPALLPLAAAAQVAPARGSAEADLPEATYKYKIFAGYAYTSLNQVNQSRYGLQGVDVNVTRELGKYVGVVADGAYYKTPLSTGSTSSTGITSNPGDPSVSAVLLGPVFHAPLYEKVSGFVDILLGGEHTGGEHQTPKVSFAGGFGGGLEYQFSKRLSVRLAGDRIGASFSLINNSPALGYSPHLSWNARGIAGVAYRF